MKYMIYSSISTWKSEEKIYGERLHKALTYLEEMMKKDVADEKFVIDEDKIFGFVTTVETEEVSARRPESHKRHIDIQFLMEGREKIGYIRKNDDLKVVSDLLEEKDNCFYDGSIDGEVFLDLKPGDFAVFFPDDVHRPQCVASESNTIRKAVIKIRVD